MAGIKTKVNAKALKKFQAQIASLSQAQLAEWNTAAVKELAARLLEKVRKRTPVGIYPAGSGKVGGTLRREWTVGEVKKSGGGYTVEVINPVEYASYVEFGHRTANHTGWVDGRFMLSVSEQELQADAPRILINKLNKMLGSVFK